jgi:hypothetical protein
LSPIRETVAAGSDGSGSQPEAPRSTAWSGSDSTLVGVAGGVFAVTVLGTDTTPHDAALVAVEFAAALKALLSTPSAFKWLRAKVGRFIRS